jgi:hypothetical protein
MLTFVIYIYCFSAYQKPKMQLCVSTFSSFPQKPIFINPKANFSEHCLFELLAFQLEKPVETNKALDRTLQTCSCLTISEISTFPHQLKLLGVIGQCRVANMVSEPEVLSSNLDRHDLSK